MENNNLPMDKDSLQREVKSNFGIYESALAMVLFLIFNILFELMIAGVDLSGISGKPLYYILSAAVEGVFALAAYVVAMTRHKSISEDAGANQKVNAKIVFYCFLVALVAIILFSNLTSVFLQFLTYLGYSSVLGNMEINTAGQYIGVVFSACIVAPLCEELLFRGVILSGFRKYGMRIAVIGSALVFTLMHGNAEQTVHQFIVGIIVGYVFFKTGNFWIGVIIHAFNNFIPVTSSFVLNIMTVGAEETVEVAEQVTVITPQSLLMSLFFACLFAWAGVSFTKSLLRVIIKENSRINQKEPSKDNVASIVVDGGETEIEMEVDGQVINQNKSFTDEQVKDKAIPTSAKVMIFLASAYLIFNWVYATMYGFMH